MRLRSATIAAKFCKRSWLGGEQSGHIIFPEISLAGDGMISALEVLRVMAESKRSLSDLAAGFVRYPQILLNVRVGEQTSAGFD
ncbi:MAG: hypothetical protein AAB401_19320 [Acidobacteriota bacterium]